MGKQTTKDDTKKAAALRLLRRGLVNMTEAAQLAGTSRQLVCYWAADIDVKAARDEYLRRLWAGATRKRR